LLAGKQFDQDSEKLKWLAYGTLMAESDILENAVASIPVPKILFLEYQQVFRQKKLEKVQKKVTSSAGSKTTTLATDTCFSGSYRFYLYSLVHAIRTNPAIQTLETNPAIQGVLYNTIVGTLRIKILVPVH
jgi:hypothetical protein